MLYYIYHMQIMKGNLIATIRKEHLGMPIIMLTAKGEESDIVLDLNLGADVMSPSPSATIRVGKKRNLPTLRAPLILTT